MKSWLRIATAMACGFAVHRGCAARASRPTDLNLLARVSDPQVSPDGRHVVYVQRETDLEANRGRTDLWLVDLENAAAKPRRLTQHAANDTHPRWADGRHQHLLPVLAHRVPADLAAAARRAARPCRSPTIRSTSTPSSFSRGGGRIALAMDVFPDCADLKCTRGNGSTPPRKKSTVSARIFDSLFMRHWDTWSDGTRSNLFVAPRESGRPRRLAGEREQALDADVPSKPDGGDEEFTFSPDGTRVVFSARVADAQEAWSTNFDLYKRLPTASARAAEPDRGQSRLGHAARVPAQRRSRLARDEPSRLRSRPVRDHASAAAASCATSRRNGTVRSQHLDVARDGRTLLATANDLGQIRAVRGGRRRAAA